MNIKNLLFDFILDNICLNNKYRMKFITTSREDFTYAELCNILSIHWETMSRKKQLNILDELGEI